MRPARGLAVAAVLVFAMGCHVAPRSAVEIDDPEHLTSRAVRRALVDEGESMVSRVAAAWSVVPPSRPIPVTLVTGRGHCRAGPEGITIVADHVARHDLSHELVHYLCGDSWRMISEGLATCFTERFAHDTSSPSYVRLDDRARAYLACGIESDLSHAACRDGMDARAYEQAGSFIGYLLDRFGPERMRSLYAGPPDGFAAALGHDLPELLRAWKTRLAEEPPSSPGYADFLARVRRWQAGEGPPPDEP